MEYQGILYATLSGLFYGLLGYFGVSIINESFSIPNMLFWRFLISSILIGFVSIPKINSFRKNYVGIIKGLFCGAIFYGIGSIFYFMASQYIGTGLAMVIFFTFPAIVLFLNRLIYKIEITKNYFYSILIILVGLMFVVDISQFKFDIVGIILAILCAALYACYIVFSKNNKLPLLISALTISVGSTIPNFIFASVNHSFTIPTTVSLWMNILGIGIVCTALPILFLLKGLEYISAEKVSIFSVLEPISVLIFGMILLEEKVTLIQTVGIIIILSSTLMTSSRQKY